MTSQPPKSITVLLNKVNHGDSSARSQLWTAVYDELLALARGQLVNEAPSHARQPTSLINEAYLRLTCGENVEWANRRHFFGAAAEALRRIRIDDARHRNRQKRGGGQRPQPLDDAHGAKEHNLGELMAINEALDKLEQEDPRKAEVVMLRYFAGLTVDETAKAMELSPRRVDLEWRFGRAWLHRELSKGDTKSGP